ncbi:carbamoyltransferase family protein [Niveispirillum irakense]|uniref:carbamoyltransferase family protein n=1 Tax=Niveispirillum irakense TaxID=34011 RepID=UPI000491F728|nr:carbamoyltransferase [Niveispirillum irakense]
MRILGISAFYHDSAAALVEDGRVVAAAQEERFSRIRHDAAYPARAIDYCLAEAGCKLAAIDHVVFFDKPFLKFERLFVTAVATAPRGFEMFRTAMPVWLKDKLFQKDRLRRELAEREPEVDWASRLLFAEHHQSHAAAAFYPSPFEEAAILTLDGVGEWATTSIAIGRGNRIEPLNEIHFPHSLGLLYSAVTYHLGFKVNSGEYKVMGLAPYGQPRFKNLLMEKVIDVKADGSFRLNLAYFSYCTGLRMTNAKFDALFGRAPRAGGDEPLEPFHMDLAASVQAVTEEVVLRLTRSLARQTGLPNLCLAGGVALNCVANGKVLRDGAFRNVWVQPAAGDAGGALGAALAAWHHHLDRPRIVDASAQDGMAGAYLGPSFDDEECAKRLTLAGARFERAVDEATLMARTADALAEGQAVGWFQGRMEFGPRALGNRSILGDPRSPTMRRDLNLKIKFREGFRPFAPAVLREAAGDWFQLEGDSPYMLITTPVLERHRRSLSAEQEARKGFDALSVERSTVPAVTHVDYSARVQTVDARTNPRFAALLRAFADRTGCPMVINTSFNVRGEPIVHTPEEAFACFMGSGLDILVVGDCILRKSDQDPDQLSKYADHKTRFEAD